MNKKQTPVTIAKKYTDKFQEIMGKLEILADELRGRGEKIKILEAELRSRDMLTCPKCGYMEFKEEIKQNIKGKP